MEEKLDAFQRVSLNKKLTMQPNKYLQVIAILTGLITINSCTANKQINGTKTVVTIESDSVITDRQGNSYLLKKMPDNLLWMTNNLQLNIENSFCYDNLEENCKQYGRLYTWEAATQVCRLLRRPPPSIALKPTLLPWSKDE